MAHLKKEYKELLTKMNKELKLPKGWHYFVKKQTEKQNFIIKSKGICTCNNCKWQFKSKKKINEIEKCPKCKNEYLIKQTTYEWHIFTQDLILLDRWEDKWVIRLFEIFTRYTKDSIYHSNAAEYGRIILQEDVEDLEFANNRLVYGMFGQEYVNHVLDGKVWRKYNKHYRSFGVRGKVFDKNLKELFENTEYKFSELWTLAKMEDKVDLKSYLKKNLPSTEMLIKMKLYKLALYPERFNKKGSFKERFGIDKSYYEFMKKNNITYEELDILQWYKKENIEEIRYLNRFYIGDLKKVGQYMSFEKFVEYTKLQKSFDLQLYLDYIDFLKELKLDLKDKKYLFPDKLKEMHDEYAKQIEIKKNKKLQRNIKKRYKELEKNSYKDNKYMIIPAQSMEALEDESKQQNHCIRTYAKRYANKKSDIYFMRELKEPEKSLVTIEVINNEIVQSRGKNNSNTNKIQKKFLDKWQNEVLKVA